MIRTEYPEYQVKNMIVATTIAMLCASVATGENVEYRRAVIDMARVQVTYIDYDWQTVASQIRESLIDAGRGELVALVGPGTLEG